MRSFSSHRLLLLSKIVVLVVSFLSITIGILEYQSSLPGTIDYNFMQEQCSKKTDNPLIDLSSCSYAIQTVDSYSTRGQIKIGFGIGILVLFFVSIGTYRFVFPTKKENLFNSSQSLK